MRNMDMIYLRYRLQEMVDKILGWTLFLICTVAIVGGTAYVVHMRSEVRQLQAEIQETDRQLHEYRKKLVKKPGRPRSSRPSYLVGNVRLFTPEEITEHVHMIHRK